MSLSGLIIGIGIFIFSLFLALALPVYLTALTGQILDILIVFLLFIGFVAIFIGALDR